jgi:hypothetical protein
MPPRDVIRLVTDATAITPLATRCVADIAAQPVRWLWRKRIARGKVTMLAGHPGLGKSQIALDFAATVTTAGTWPDDACAERGSVIILSAEDDPADTIRPRLEAAGADLKRCHIIEAAQDAEGGNKPKRRTFSLVKDIPRLDAELRRIGDVALIIIDPISAYLDQVDSHHNAEVRAVLAPLAELAGRRSIAIVAISHLRKSLAGDAVLQVTGSLAFAAAARAVYIIARDPDDPAHRLFLPAKNNLGDDRTGHAYRVEPVSLPNGISTCRIAWKPEPITMTADEALAPRDRGTANGGRGRAPKHNAAKQWLAGVLAAGPVPVATLRADAEGAGYSWSTIRRAQDALGVTAEKAQFEGGWVWRLPKDAVRGAEIEL